MFFLGNLLSLSLLSKFNYDTSNLFLKHLNNVIIDDLNDTCVAENQHKLILYALALSIQRLESMIYRCQGEHTQHYITEKVYLI